MRIRAFDSKGDYRFGSLNQFLVDTPEAVAQAIGQRLRLMVGEWFLDLDAGTDYAGQVLGTNTRGTRDFEIQQRILNTPGVTQLVEYASQVDEVTRKFSVQARVDTDYGELLINNTF